MSSVNLFTREISIKIVYYGPGLGGKTSSLQYIHRALKTDSRGQLVSLATGVDRTLYFDFLPVKLPKLRGYSIRVQLYTVPGQVHYNSTRKLVLAGCDGVVFVSDSQRERETANVESLENLRENLAEQGLRLEQVPLILQYNKRDVPDPIPIAELAARLNPTSVPAFETVATTGRGVFEALKAITSLVLNDLRRRGIWDGGEAPAPKTPATATEFTRTEASIAQRLAALSEAADAVAKLEPARADRTTGTHAAVPSVTPVPQPLPAGGSGPQATNGSPMGRLPLAPRVLPAEAWAELLPPGPAREQVHAVQGAIARGDYAEAVRTAARAFAEESRAEATEPEIAPVLHALVLGMGGKRYLRFCEVAQRAEQGSASSLDALYALFFLVDATVER